MTIGRKDTVDPAKADWTDDPSRFAGKVGRHELARTTEGVQVLVVFFEAGARNRPHIHVNDQVLVCIDGEGVVSTAADEGQPDVMNIRPTDTVHIPRGTWHWHGARRESPMTHLSIIVADDGDQWESVDPKDWDDYRGG